MKALTLITYCLLLLPATTAAQTLAPAAEDPKVLVLQADGRQPVVFRTGDRVRIKTYDRVKVKGDITRVEDAALWIDGLAFPIDRIEWIKPAGRGFWSILGIVLLIVSVGIFVSLASLAILTILVGVPAAFADVAPLLLVSGMLFLAGVGLLAGGGKNRLTKYDVQVRTEQAALFNPGP